MSGNKDKLEDFEDFDGGEVTFRGSTGKISGKGTIKTKNLNFKNVLYVEELQHFNIILVSQICDQAYRVLFTENECLVLFKDFPLPDPSMVILYILRKHNLYTFSLNELTPKGPLTCLIAKASQDESTLWHRRLGHVNFRNMNKLVILGRRPTRKPVNPNRPKPVSAGQQNPVSAGQQNPVFAGPSNSVSAEQQNIVSAGKVGDVVDGVVVLVEYYREVEFKLVVVEFELELVLVLDVSHDQMVTWKSKDDDLIKQGRPFRSKDDHRIRMTVMK
nr:ribonuclease H-like domain-containing protein [Tanacetum cinerariifolium]